MKNKMNFDFYYGKESEQFTFLRIPKLLMTDPVISKISADAKILYSLMLDRMSLSRENEWFDEENRVYIIYTIEQISKDMNCGRDKAISILAELDDTKGIGLVMKKRRGQGKPSLLYVKNFVKNEENNEPKNEVETTDFKKSEKPISRIRQSRILNIDKSDSINTNINNTKKSNINPSIKYTDDVIDAIEIAIKNRISYDALCYDYGAETIDMYVSLILEVMITDKVFYKIAGGNVPGNRVKKVFSELTMSHIQYVIFCMQNSKTQISDIKSYVIAALYNAPAMMHQYYNSKVNGEWGY